MLRPFCEGGSCVASQALAAIRSRHRLCPTPLRRRYQDQRFDRYEFVCLLLAGDLEQGSRMRELANGAVHFEFLICLWVPKTRSSTAKSWISRRVRILAPHRAAREIRPVS